MTYILFTLAIILSVILIRLAIRLFTHFTRMVFSTRIINFVFLLATAVVLFYVVQSLTGIL